jgi:ABC-2 type transport system ATP-binding protein
METVAKITSVSKNFGNVSALSDLSLDVKQGQAIALLGPNGAGKSTALTILQGLRKPSAGTAELYGFPAGSREAMQRVGVTPQVAEFPAQMTPRDLLKFAVAHYQNPHSVNHLIETFNLADTADRQMAGFSGGQKRRVALALCFAGNPDLVILDEPTTGLDAAGQLHFQNIANEFVARGGSLVLTSHHWPEIENIADHITMIDEGKTVMSGAIADIKSAVDLARVSLKSAKPGRLIKQSFERHAGRWSTVTDNADELVRTLVASKEPFQGLRLTPLGLDEALTIYRANQNTGN